MERLNFMKNLFTCGCMVLFFAKYAKAYETPCYEYCKCDEIDGKVICEKAELKEIHPDIDRHFFSISLSHNNITNITNNDFAGCTELKCLDLGHNNIETIDQDAFSDLRQLKVLSLESNKISNLDVTLFKSLSSLTQLNLRNNYIEQLDPGIFKNLSELRELYLDNNRLVYLKPGTFAGLAKSLQTVKLGSNNIRCVHPDAFATNEYLTSLVLSNNPNLILPTHHSLINSKSLKSLDLSKCRIKSVPSTIFENSTKLEIIFLQSNEILVIGVDPFKPLLNLQHLHLSHNPLECDCKLKPLWVYLKNKSSLSSGICKTPSQYCDNSWDVLEHMPCVNYSEKGNVSDSEVQDCINFDYTVIPEDDRNVSDKVLQGCRKPENDVSHSANNVQLILWSSVTIALLVLLVLGGLYICISEEIRNH